MASSGVKIGEKLIRREAHRNVRSASFARPCAPSPATTARPPRLRQRSRGLRRPPGV
jgi:hypothetical protein